MKSHTLRLLLACLWCWATLIPLRVEAIPLWVFAGGTASESNNLPLASTVVAWYSLSTNGADASGNGNTLSGLGTPTHGAGLVGDSYQVTATNKYYSASDAAWQEMSGDFSIAAWIKPADGQPAAQQGIFCKWTYTGDQRAYRLVLDTNGTILFGISADGTSVTSHAVSSTTALANGAASSWTFVVGVFDGGNSLTIYVNNGSPDVNPTAIPAAANNTGTSSVRLGTIAGVAAENFLGGLDEVALFNVALSSDQVLALYNTANGVSFADLP